jgi:hypothetical protein
MLIAADALFANISVGDRQLSVMSRKHRIYRYFSTLLDESGGRVTDEILGGIIMGAVTEARLSDSTAWNAHIQGFESAIRDRGGLRASLVACGFPALRFSHLMPYLMCGPGSLHDIEEDNSNEEFEQFTRFLTLQMCCRGFSTSPEDVSPEAGLPQMASIIVGLGSSLLRTPLAFYLEVDDRRIVHYADESSSFLSIFLITLTLWKASESLHTMQLFIQRLQMVLEGSCAFDENGMPMLTLQGLMFAVIKGIQDIQAQINSMSEETELWPILHGVDALRVYRSMRSYKARRSARALLLRILLGENPTVRQGRM